MREALLDRRWGSIVSGARSRRAGGAARGDPAHTRTVCPPHRSHGEFSGCGGWEQKKARIFGSGKGWIDGGTSERDEHVPLGPFTRRLSSTPTLVPRFGLDRPQMIDDLRRLRSSHTDRLSPCASVFAPILQRLSERSGLADMADTGINWETFIA